MTRPVDGPARLLVSWRLLWSLEAASRWMRDWPDGLPVAWRRDWLTGQRLGLWCVATAERHVGAALGDLLGLDGVPPVAAEPGLADDRRGDMRARPGEPWICEPRARDGCRAAASVDASRRAAQPPSGEDAVATIQAMGVAAMVLPDAGRAWCLPWDAACLRIAPDEGRSESRASGRMWTLPWRAAALAVRIDAPPVDLVGWRALFDALADHAGALAPGADGCALEPVSMATGRSADRQTSDGGDGALPNGVCGPVRCLVGLDVPLATLESLSTLVDLLGHARA